MAQIAMQILRFCSKGIPSVGISESKSSKDTRAFMQLDTSFRVFLSKTRVKIAPIGKNRNPIAELKPLPPLLAAVVGFGWTGFNEVKVVIYPFFFIFLLTKISDFFLASPSQAQIGGFGPLFERVIHHF